MYGVNTKKRCVKSDTALRETRPTAVFCL